MERMTLREAGRRTGRSITTLRRYVRGGRLRAELRHGRFGPEYFVTLDDLTAAKLEPGPGTAIATGPPPRLARPGSAPALPAHGSDPVPIVLFQELQMKHEQLLVQYGMVRAGGVRALEIQAALEARQRELEASREQVARLTERLQRETSRLGQGLREAQLELEGRALEIAALREKVRALEMLTRNAVTNETIERQFSAVMSQARRVRGLTPTLRAVPTERGEPDLPDH
jgi:hypothetical protein